MNGTPSIEDIHAAHKRIKPYIHKTPVLTSTFLNDLTNCEMFFKCENFQKIGAFKARGASNVVLSLNKQAAACGVVTHSSGNHGLALSYAAGRKGISCTVVMPNTAPLVKKNAVKEYGGKIVECEPTTSSRESTSDDIVKQTGATLVHPYNDMRVIAGQATCAVELINQIPELSAVVTPIGGGGLSSGTGLALHNLSPLTSLYAAEPEQADDAYRSFKSGVLVEDDAPQTIADGLKVPLKDITWHFVSKHVNDIFTVSEQEIVDAMLLIWQRMKIVVEASCAVPLAAIIKNRSVFQNRRVGVILTGGNVDLGSLPWQLSNYN